MPYGTNSESTMPSLTGTIWEDSSGRTGTWGVPETRHDKFRVDLGKNENCEWEHPNRTAYHWGASHLKNGIFSRFYSREKFTESGGTYENRAY